MLETSPMDRSERIEIVLTACKDSSYFDCLRSCTWDIKVLGFHATGGTANSLAAKLSTGAMLETLPMDRSERIEIVLTAFKDSSYFDCLRSCTWDIKVLGFHVTGVTTNSLAAKLSIGAMLETLPMDSSERIEILLTACKDSSYFDCLRKWFGVVHQILKITMFPHSPKNAFVKSACLRWSQGPYS